MLGGAGSWFSGAWRAAWGEHRSATVGLAGALLLVAGAGSYLAMANPPYLQDEAAHVGYTLRLRQGDLPTVDTPIPEGHGPALDATIRRGSEFFSPDVYVANNPPAAYLAAIPLAEAAERSGNREGPLLGLRLLNVAGAVVAVACTFLLGRELSGGDHLTGVVSAGLLAGLISVAMICSIAGLDGVALAATTGTAWQLARFARSRSSADAARLGLWCAAAAAVRPMSLAFAMAAGAMALGLAWRTHGWRPLLPITIRLAGPSMVVVGWFYVLNLSRYGDPTGSRALFEKFAMESRSLGFFDVLGRRETFATPFTYLLREPYDAWPFYAPGRTASLVTGAAVALLLGAVVLAWRSSNGRPRGGPATLVPAAWISAAVLAVVPVVLLAQHASGGGGAHPRYLLPALPVFAAATALVVRRVSRWLSVLLVLAAVAALVSRLRTAAFMRFPVPDNFGPHVQESLVGQPFRSAGLLVAVAGATSLIAGISMLAIRSRPDPW